jgi:hypothetical protein
VASYAQDAVPDQIPIGQRRSHDGIVQITRSALSSSCLEGAVKKMKAGELQHRLPRGHPSGLQIHTRFDLKPEAMAVEQNECVRFAEAVTPAEIRKEPNIRARVRDQLCRDWLTIAGLTQGAKKRRNVSASLEGTEDEKRRGVLTVAMERHFGTPIIRSRFPSWILRNPPWPMAALGRDEQEALGFARLIRPHYFT